MATCRPGDTIIAPPASIGGHVTHHADGAAGRYGLHTVSAPVTADGYTVNMAGGLIVTNDAELAERLDAIAYPSMTANFDAGKTAALAVTMLDWKVAGQAYAQTMIATAQRLVDELVALDVPIFCRRPRWYPVTSVRGAGTRVRRWPASRSPIAPGEPAHLRPRPRR
jgi:glycine/serine hydroxymethyltransferase